MSDTRAQALALIARAVERAVGTDVTEVQLAIAFAMFDQLDRRRRRRSARAIKTLNPTLRTRRDRSIAAAFPVLYLAAFRDLPVTVMVTDAARAREDADLYRAVIGELGAETPVGILADERDALAASEREQITIATPQALAAAGGHYSMIIARTDPAATKRVTRLMHGVAGLPDL